MAIRQTVAVVLKSLLFLCVLTLRAEDHFEWKPGFEWPAGHGFTGLNNPLGGVSVLAALDLGDGPALYAAGDFRTGTSPVAYCIARWDGAGWTPLGSVSQPLCGISSLTVYDDGTGPVLHAAGPCELAGIDLLCRVFKWDGVAWATVGIANNRVHALAVFDDGTGPALIAGGQFSSIDGATFRGIAKWDGRSWTSLTTGVLGVGVFALSVFDDGTGPALFVGGSFGSAGGVAVNSVAKWDGQSWTSMGSGIGQDVLAFTIFDDGNGPALYAGGAFGSLPGRVRRWNGGASWTQLGSGFTRLPPLLGGIVSALIVFDDGTGPALYAAGRFNMTGGVTVNHIAKWDGAAWTPLADGLNNQVFTLGVFDDGSGPALFAGGIFSTAGEVPSSRIAKWAAQ